MRTLALALVLSALTSERAHAQGFALRYEFGSRIPGPQGIVSWRGDAPALEGDVLAFRTPSSVYTFNTATRLATPIASVQTPAPPNGTSEPSGTFTSFYSTPVINNGHVAFGAFTTRGRTIVTNAGGVMTCLFPPSPGVRFSDPVLDGSTIIYSEGTQSRSRWTPGTGVRAMLTAVTDPNSNPPHLMEYVGDIVRADRGRVVFDARYPLGLFIADSLDHIEATVARASTQIPGGSGGFENIYQRDISGDQVVFEGANAQHQTGLYFTKSGALHRLIDDRMLLPGGGPLFPGVSPDDSLAISDGNIAFVTDVGSGFAPKTLYAYTQTDRQLRRVVGSGDIVDDRVVSHVWFRRDGLSGRALAFGLEFTDQSWAIYTTQIPAPAPLALLACGAALCLLRRRRGA